MAMKVMDAGSVLRTITKYRVLEGASLRNILRMKVMDADGVTLRTVATFAQPLSLSISPSPVDGTGPGTEPATITSDLATASPSGGLGPYSYSWAYVSGDTVTITSPSSAATTFSREMVWPKQIATATVRCTCTDSSGQSATADLTVFLSNI